MARFSLLIAIAAALTVVACGGDDGARSPTAARPTASATASPEATSTAVPTPQPIAGCPLERAACDFSAQVAAAVERGDVDAIVASARPEPYTCPDPATLGELQPLVRLCAGASEGEVREGYAIAALQSEGGVVDGAALRRFVAGWLEDVDPSASDELGSGAIRPATIGCDTTEGEPVCDERYAIVFTAIGSGGVRVLLQVVVENEPSPAVAQVVRGLVPLNQEMVMGGTAPASLRFDPAAGPARYVPVGETPP